MRVLVYGFGPYKQFRKNITQAIVSKLPSSRNLKKIVFPVRFDKKQFIDALRKYRPDVVLGLGQCSQGGMMRMERRAVNKRRGNKQTAQSIVRGGFRRLPTTLRLEKSALGKQWKISHSAGDYVCNFSMYVILDYLRRHGRHTPFGFVHVPHDYDLKRAVGLVRKLLKMLDASLGRVKKRA